MHYCTIIERGALVRVNDACLLFVELKTRKMKLEDISYYLVCMVVLNSIRVANVYHCEEFSFR